MGFFFKDSDDFANRIIKNLATTHDNLGRIYKSQS